MGKAPADQFYWMDWARDLQEHPLKIEGAWIRICCKLWWSDTRGEMTKSPLQWARILGVSKQSAMAILKYIKNEKIGGVTFHNPKVTVLCRRMVRDEKARQSNRDKASRWRDRQKENNNPESNPKVTPPSSSSSSSSPSSSKKRTKDIAQTDDNHERRFLVFWSKYPKKKSKLAARKAFDKISPEGDLFNRIIDKIEEASKSHDWTKDSGKFIPYPERWLNSGGWEDEYKPQDNRFSDITRQNIEMFKNWEPPEDTK